MLPVDQQALRPRLPLHFSTGKHLEARFPMEFTVRLAVFYLWPNNLGEEARAAPNRPPK